MRKLRLGSIEFRLSMNALDRAEYAFGVHQALLLASLLRLDRVSVVEFGVAQGHGLILLEQYAVELGKKAGITVEVYGFDTGSGLPPALDYRDINYLWRGGHFPMDVAALQKKLQIAKLYLGNVAETIPKFLESDAAPVGFISIDVDYYSSTAAALKLFDGPDSKFLPRVACYFDDIVNDGIRIPCSYVGEPLAIREFNECGEGQKLCPWGIWDPRRKAHTNWHKSSPAKKEERYRGRPRYSRARRQ